MIPPPRGSRLPTPPPPPPRLAAASPRRSLLLRALVCGTVLLGARRQLEATPGRLSLWRSRPSRAEEQRKRSACCRGAKVGKRAAAGLPSAQPRLFGRVAPPSLGQCRAPAIYRPALPLRRCVAETPALALSLSPPARSTRRGCTEAEARADLDGECFPPARPGCECPSHLRARGQPPPKARLEAVTCYSSGGRGLPGACVFVRVRAPSWG